MKKSYFDLEASGLAASLAGAALALGACSGNQPASDPQVQVQAESKEPGSEEEEGTSEPVEKLPFVEGRSEQVLAELLRQPTALGETTAVHVRLPPPQDPKLADSLVRVVGRPDSLQVLFRSDSLAQLGVIPRSPGKDFFTSFGTLSRDELERVARDEKEIAGGVFGDTTEESLVFEGRNAIGRTTNVAVDPSRFQIGLAPIPVNACPVTVVSTIPQAWGKSLFITDPAVVQDPTRTWDPCTGAGTPGGVWTFAHLVREMAAGSLNSPEDFVKEWLSQWLNSYVVNGDIVPARPEMFTQVIQPWAIASGETATLTVDPFTQKNVLTLSGPLNLDFSPLSLRAIVNRIDLGKTAAGGGGYSNSTASMPTTPGELRFIFGVVEPSPWGAGTEATCGRKPFTVIFEYGVPGNTCNAVVAWAKKWTQLQAHPGFSAPYRALLESMTESVVKLGAAPSKGNQNALNQIRTNEAALAGPGCGGPVAGPWEMREFTLTNENPAANTDVPATGLLRKHTVARTPDDGAFSAGGPDITINAFTGSNLVVPASATVAPPNCNTVANYNVPFAYPVAGSPFRGGNSLMMPPYWRATLNPSTQHNFCARHQFSLNTCNGCHRGETATNGLGGNTNFTHIDPLSPAPVPLSKFLTGGGPGLTHNVNDPQYGSSIVWKYADLQRRLQRLYDLSHCTVCFAIPTLRPAFIDQISALGPVPADIDPEEARTFPVGSITNLGVVDRLLQLRASFAGESQSTQVDFARPAEAFSH